MSASDQCAQISQLLDRKPRPCNKLVGTYRSRLGHPRRQQRQRAIGLPDDEMVGASVTLRVDDHDRLAAARVKRIENPNLNRQTPGSMTPLRPIPLHSAHLAITL
jgi:hypothetical protein